MKTFYLMRHNQTLFN